MSKQLLQCILLLSHHPWRRVFSLPAQAPGPPAPPPPCSVVCKPVVGLPGPAARNADHAPSTLVPPARCRTGRRCCRPCSARCTCTRRPAATPQQTSTSGRRWVPPPLPGSNAHAPSLRPLEADMASCCACARPQLCIGLCRLRPGRAAVSCLSSSLTRNPRPLPPPPLPWLLQRVADTPGYTACPTPTYFASCPTGT